MTFPDKLPYTDPPDFEERAANCSRGADFFRAYLIDQHNQTYTMAKSMNSPGMANRMLLKRDLSHEQYKSVYSVVA